MKYEITWITEFLGVGRAPMSYEEFDAIRDQGIHAIVNLCREYTDLHTLEEEAGFEVYYLPTYDEYAPEIDDLEKALQWLDEAIYLKKKVLVHCRFGQGRTGTFTSAYLLRRGLDIKGAKKELKKTKASPSNYRQWKVVKKYGKRQGNNTFHTPHVPHNQTKELSHFYENYKELAALADEQMASSGITHLCGKNNDCCCHTSFNMPLLEALYLNESLNLVLSTTARTAAIKRALDGREKFQNSLKCLNPKQPQTLQELYIKDDFLCPLSIDNSCILYEFRPIRCRSNGGKGISSQFMETIMDELGRLSNETFLLLAGKLPRGPGISSSLMDTVSGKFIQTYFHLMADVKDKTRTEEREKR